MRNEPNLRVEGYRKTHPYIPYVEQPYGANWGYFEVGELRIISSGGGLTVQNPEACGWEHVSVSCANRTPTWAEMDKVKKLFWSDDETVVQFHPRETAKINFMQYCLHLWKPANSEWMLPPSILVG